MASTQSIDYIDFLKKFFYMDYYYYNFDQKNKWNNYFKLKYSQIYWNEISNQPNEKKIIEFIYNISKNKFYYSTLIKDLNHVNIKNNESLEYFFNYINKSLKNEYILKKYIKEVLKNEIFFKKILKYSSNFFSKKQ